MTEKPIKLYAGADVELMAQLDNLAPGHTYEYTRRLCRKAAQRLQELRAEIYELKEQLGENDAE